jgi:hypothetical protein
MYSEVHDKALTRLRPRRSHLPKMCSEILPTTQNHPRCGLTIRQSKKTAITYWKVVSTARVSTPSYHHITKALQRNQDERDPHYHHDRWPSIISLEKYPHAFHQLIHQQTAISWRQVFNGRIAKEWNCNATTTKPTPTAKWDQGGDRTIAGQSWTILTIAIIWTGFFDLYGHQNNK